MPKKIIKNNHNIFKYMSDCLTCIPAPPPTKTGWPWTEETNPAVYDQRNDWPKISIVTPSYNQGQFLEETIRSVLLQNYPNLEYIIIDGGSSDDSVEIIKKYDKWIDYWVSEPDEGQSDAINKGLEKCSGNIFNWLNSDDYIFQKALYEIANGFLDNPSSNFIYGNTLNSFTLDKNSYSFHEGSDDALQIGLFPYSQQSCFLSLDMVKSIGGIDNSHHYKMAKNLYLKVKLKNKNFVNINKLIGFYRFHGESKSTNHNYGFFEESLLIMNRLINSEKSLAKFEKIMIEFGLYRKTKKRYQISEFFSEDVWNDAFYHFLAHRVLHHYYNEVENFDLSRKIVKYVMNNYPIIKTKNNQYSNVFIHRHKNLITYPNIFFRLKRKYF